MKRCVLLILVVVLTWLVLRDKFKQRRVHKRLQRKRDEIKEKRAKASYATEGRK